MKSQLHVIALVLFAICFLYDIVVWGGVPALPKVGAYIADAAHREAPLATTYIAIGAPLDEALPSLGDYANARLTDAFAEGFDRIREDPGTAMDFIFSTTWNPTHRWIKAMYWGAPIMLLVTTVLWFRRPKPVHAFRR
jgi:hypothetical protein